MVITGKVREDMMSAMRAHEKEKVAALRLIMAAFKQIEVDERITIDDARAIQILDKLAKQRKESIEQFQVANRTDLVEKERAELVFIQSYLPAPLSEHEVEGLIQQAIQTTAASNISSMGQVMATLKPQLQGRCDMAKVSQRLKALLT